MPAGHPHAVYGRERFKMLLTGVLEPLIGLTMNPFDSVHTNLLIVYTKLHMFKKSSLLDISIEDLFNLNLL